MSVSFDFDGRVAIVTGACGALGSSVVEAFLEAGATVCAIDIVDIAAEESMLAPADDLHFHRADATDEAEVERIVDEIVTRHGRIDHLCNVAGTWRGGSPIDETDLQEVEFLFEINVITAFLVSKHAIPHLRKTNGSIVNVSARSSLEGGPGDGPYRATKASIRLLTETIAQENLGEVRANAVMPSVIDTPANREMMDPSDDWVDPDDIARVFLILCSDAAAVTSGAAIPVYGEA